MNQSQAAKARKRQRAINRSRRNNGSDSRVLSMFPLARRVSKTRRGWTIIQSIIPAPLHVFFGART